MRPMFKKGRHAAGASLIALAVICALVIPPTNAPAQTQGAVKPATPAATSAAKPANQNSTKPNILVIFGDDIGQSNVSAYTHGLMGYKTPNIDRIAAEGMMFTDYYAENSCTAGRSSFITGQVPLRTGRSEEHTSELQSP